MVVFTCAMVPCIDYLFLLYLSWKKHIENVRKREAHSKTNNLEGDWSKPSVTFKTDQTDFLLAVEPFSNSLRIPLGRSEPPRKAVFN